VKRFRYRVEPDRTGFLRAARLTVVRANRGNVTVREGLEERAMRSKDLFDTREEAWRSWRDGVRATRAGLTEDVERIQAELARLDALLAKHGGKQP
jgi:hypothetical protein